MSVIEYPQRVQKIEYPESDGEPMAESEYQQKPLIYVLEALRAHFANDANLWVSGDIFVYYEEGRPDMVVAPDVLVVKGVENKTRASYKVWEENGRTPDFVLEITSRSTKARDQGEKKGIYAYLGVREYFLYDPTRDYLDPPLQAYRLLRGFYEPREPQLLTDGTLVLHSEVLELDFRLKDSLRLFDPVEEKPLLTYAELDRANQTAKVRIAELEAQLRALKEKSD